MIVLLCYLIPLLIKWLRIKHFSAHYTFLHFNATSGNLAANMSFLSLDCQPISLNGSLSHYRKSALQKDSVLFLLQHAPVAITVTVYYVRWLSISAKYKTVLSLFSPQCKFALLAK